MASSSARFQKLLDRITYRDWSFRAVCSSGRDYLQVTFDDRCVETGQPARQYCRKWLLSQRMSDAEVVQTALKAVLTAEEHEARERFGVDGERIFSPHLELDELLAQAKERRANRGRAIGAGELA